MTVDRTNGNVFAATNRGLFESTDGGTSWNQISLASATDLISSPNVTSASGGVNAVIQDPVDPSSYWVAVADWCHTEQGNILKLTNGIWQRAGLNLHDPHSRFALAISADGKVVYAAVASCIQSSVTKSGWYPDGKLVGIEKTTDGGSSWGIITPNSTNGLTDYFSEPGGGEFQGWYDNVAAVDPADSTGKHAVFGGVTEVATSDGGTTFTDVARPYDQSSPLQHPDFHAIAFTGTAGSFYSGNDGGVWSTTNFGSSWNNLNSSLEITQFYSGTAQSISNMIGGSQDNGTNGIIPYVSEPTPTTWTPLLGGDGGWTAIVPSPSSLTYQENTDLDLYQVDDSAGTATAAGPCDFSANTGPACTDIANGRVGFIAPFVMSPSNPKTLYAGTDQVYRTTAGGTPAGSAWQLVSGDLTTGANNRDFINTMALGQTSATGPAVVYTGSWFGKVEMAIDPSSPTNPGWTDISGGLPAFSSTNYTGNSWITGIAVNPANYQEIWVTIGTSSTSGRIWHTTDRGTTWNDLSGNLPSVVVDSVAVDPVTASVYLGTDAGAVVCTTCGGMTATGTWYSLGTGLPNAKVDAISMTADSAWIIAWSHGRGAWKIAPPAPRPGAVLSPSTLDFGSVDVGTTTAPQSISLTNDGQAPLAITGTSTDNPDFKIVSGSNSCTTALPQQTSCNIWLTFTPSVASQEGGHLTVSDNAPNSPQTAGLTGSGNAVNITFSRSPGSQIAFPDTNVNTTSSAQTVVLTNNGPGHLTISSIGINSGSDFILSNKCPISPQQLPAGSSCSISVSFRPLSLGLHGAQLGINDNSTNYGSLQGFNLNGKGVAQNWEGTTGDPAGSAGIASWGPGRLDVFYRRANQYYANRLGHLWYSNGWHEDDSLTDQLSSDPRAVSWGAGRLDVFWQGQNNTLMHKWFQGSWGASESLGDLPISGVPVASTWGPGRLDVFARSTSGSLIHEWFDGSWHEQTLDWAGLLNSDPAAVSWSSGRIDLFWLSSSKSLLHAWFNGSWGGPEDKGGYLTSAPTVSSWGSGRLDVFALGSDANIWHLWYGGGWGSWGRWSGGQFQYAPTAVSWGSGRIDIAENQEAIVFHDWYP